VCRLGTVGLCWPSCCAVSVTLASALLAPANLHIMEQQLLTYTVLGIGPYKLHQLHTSGGKVGVVQTCDRRRQHCTPSPVSSKRVTRCHVHV
jgi:hypothetical protein